MTQKKHIYLLHLFPLKLQSVNRDVMLHHDYIGRLDFVDKYLILQQNIIISPSNLFTVQLISFICRAKERARAVKDAYEDMYVPDRQEIGRQVGEIKTTNKA